MVDGGEFAARVRDVINSLAAGELATYGEVAAGAGRPGAARAVGSILARSHGLPWWRVITASGRLTPGHELRQARLLAEENVLVRGNHVVGFPLKNDSRREIDGAAPERQPLQSGWPAHRRLL
jgi:alkylated DNA nucleotide flippase Atl1